MKKAVLYLLSLTIIVVFICLQASSEMYTENGTPCVDLSPLNYVVVFDGINMTDSSDKASDKEKKSKNAATLQAEGKVKEVKTSVNGAVSVIMEGTVEDEDGKEVKVTLHCDMTEDSDIPSKGDKVKMDASLGGPLDSEQNTWLLVDAEIAK